MDKSKAEEDLKATELLVCEMQKESEDYQLMLASIERELLDVKQTNQEQIQVLDREKEEIKHAMQSEIDTMKAIHEESNRRLEDLRVECEVKMQALEKRDVEYQTFLFSRLELFQAYYQHSFF